MSQIKKSIQEKPADALFNHISIQTSRNIHLYTFFWFSATIFFFSLQNSSQTLHSLSWLLYTVFLHPLMFRSFPSFLGYAQILYSLAQNCLIKDDFPQGSFLGLEQYFLSLVYIYVLSQDMTCIIVSLGFHIGLQQFLMNDISMSPPQEIPVGEYYGGFSEGLGYTFLMAIFLLLIHRFILNRAYNEFTKSKNQEIDSQHDFFMSVSHELRTPLNGLLGNLQLALDEDLPLHVNTILKSGKSCGELLLYLINDLLDRNKIENGELEVNPRPIDITKSLEEIWGICSEIIKKKDIEGHFKIARNIPHFLNLDCHRLTQILLNLVGNAVKFTDKGLVRVSVKWIENKHQVDEDCFLPYPYDETQEGIFEKDENMYILNRPESAKSFKVLDLKSKNVDSNILLPSSSSKGVLKIIVSDTGCGILDEDISKLFMKYVQLNTDDSKRKIGNGLGLFVTKELCNKMRGEIKAFSKPNKGSTFIVCIPVTTVTTPEATLVEQRKLKANLRPLILEKSKFGTPIFPGFLAKHGISNYVMAKDPMDLLHEFKKKSFLGKRHELVVIDTEGDEMKAIEIAEQIREYEAFHKLEKCCFVIVVDSEKNPLRKICLEMNGKILDSQVLTRPISFTQFSRIISKRFC